MLSAKHCLDCGQPLNESHAGSVCVLCLWGGEPDAGDPEETSSGTARTGTAVRPSGATALRVPGHDVKEEIARGGMSIVYRAWERGPGRDVALKMLRPQLGDDPEMHARFRQEARAMAALNHPAILPVYRVDENEDLPFFTMKLAGGGTLASRRLQYQGQWRSIAELMATLAEAAHFAHSHGVLHRDIKPGNILFDESGRPYLSDFGLVKVIDADESLTMTEHFLGTPHYASPEVAAANAASATVASDVWSLGIVLFELLAGRLPFEAEGVPALLRKIVESPCPALPAEVPRDLSVICQKCLGKLPSSRYQGAGVFADDLRRWLNGRSITARPMSRPEKLWSWARRNPAPACLAAALLGALILAGILALREARTNLRLLEQSRSGEMASRRAEAAALLSQARARMQSGAWLERQEIIDSVQRSISLRPSNEARDLLASLHALPTLTREGSLPYTRGWNPSADRNLRRYVTLEPQGCLIRDTATHEVLFTIKDLPYRNYPPGPLSPDGSQLVVTGERSSTIWDVESGTKLAAPGRISTTTLFSGDGRILTYFQRESRLTGFCDLSVSPPALRQIEGTPLNWIPRAVSWDGKLIMLAAQDGSGIKLADTATASVIRDFQIGQGAFIHSACFTRAGDQFYAAMIDGRVARWSVYNPLPDWVAPAHSGGVDGVALFNDDRYLLTQGRDGMTRIWDLRTNGQVLTLPWQGHSAFVSTDSRRLLIDHHELSRREILRFAPPEAAMIGSMPPSFAPNTYLQGEATVIPMPDSRLFAVSGGHDVHFFDRDGNGPSDTLKYGRNDRLAADPAGGNFIRFFSSGGSWNVLVCPMDPARVGQRNSTVNLGSFRGARLAINPATRRLLITYGQDFASFAPGSGGSWKPAPLPDFGKIFVYGLTVSPSGKYFAWCGRVTPGAGKGPEPVQIWIADGKTLEILSTIPCKLAAGSLAFTADETALVAMDQQNISCIGLSTRSTRWSLPHRRNQNSNPPRLAVAAVTGEIAATLELDSVSLIDPADGRIRLNLTHPLGGTIRAIGLTSDGTRLLSLAGTIVQLWKLDELVRRGLLK